jgi:predicted acylesterase/phospholipase RssA
MGLFMDAINHCSGASPFRRGLVIGGGGAKGAYALGCLLALSESGISFDAVAGTSVGGLLAAIWSSGRIKQAAELWRTSHGLRAIGLKKPILFSLLGSLLYVPLRASASPLSVLIQAHTVALTGTSLLVFGFFYLLGIAGKEEVPLILAILVLAIVVGVVSFLAAKRVAILSNQNLKRHLDQLFDGAKFAIPTFVTLCKSCNAIDPDYPLVELGMTEFSTDKIIPITEFVPVYRALGPQYTEENRDLLLATAALPFGLIAPVKVDGHWYSDGGQADNIPFTPLIDSCGCDEIFVINLQGGKKVLRSIANESRQKHWQALDRRARVAALRCSDAEQLYLNRISGRYPLGHSFDPPVSVPFRRFQGKWPIFVDIVPEQPIGGFLSGTLNFSLPKTLRLIEQGHRDTEMLLKRYKTCVASP